MDLSQEFHKKLDNLIQTKPDQMEGDPLEFSRFDLTANLGLLASLCNEVAQISPAFLNETSFKKVPQRSLTPPEKPDINDPSFVPPSHTVYPPEAVEKYGWDKIQAVATARNYHNALKIHEEKTKDYSRLRAQTFFIRDNLSPDREAYLDYVFDALRLLCGENPKLPVPPDVSLSNLAFSAGRSDGSQTIPPKPTLPAGFVDQFFFTPKTFAINETMRWRHTFICGGTGSGKSQTILNIIRHYLTANTKTAVVVFDPHGKDLAELVVKMPEFADSDRLLSIDLSPALRRKHAICFNPFDCKDKSREALSTFSKQLAGAIGQLFPAGITDQMLNVLIPCITVLLHRDGSTLDDLYRFMDNARNEDLVEYGQTRIPNEIHQEFFKRDFLSPREYAESKSALKRRLFSVIGDTNVRDFLCQPSTFDLESALEAGKVIVLNGRGGAVDSDAIRVIGQLLTAYISSYAVRRYQIEDELAQEGKSSPKHPAEFI